VVVSSSFPPSRRRLIAASVAALGLTLNTGPCFAQIFPAAHANTVSGTQHSTSAAAPAEDTSIRPFRIAVPQPALDDLRKRIAATRWPDPELVTDQSQGVKLAKIQDLVRYWGTGYDWRKAEAKLNALPEFVTRIDGVDIQFA
jgi:hypothetical protein